VKALKVGDGAQPGIEQGPLINLAAVEKVESLIADGVKRGAKIDLGGKRHKLGGTFFEPTILRDATPEMAFAREEIFGPVVTLFRFAKDEDAIRMANDTEYGLAAYFYARDVGRIFKVMEGLQYGIVGVNEGIISTEVAPFGGMKESGIGREGSKYGIDDFVQIKYVAMGGLGIP
jgi:succinate-semialdehyde dehydrogenase/glutarate-semialdehyde dehydrogenase